MIRLETLYMLSPDDGGVGGNGGSVSRPDDFDPVETYYAPEKTNAFVHLGLSGDDDTWTDEQYDIALAYGRGDISAEEAIALIKAHNS